MNEQHCSEGRVSSLPGSKFTPEENTVCDTHENRAAVVKIQGETDSFGAEYLYLCQECLDEYNKASAIEVENMCDWCKTTTTDCQPYRDFEEGSSGPVYTVCKACRQKHIRQLREDWSDEDYGQY